MQSYDRMLFPFSPNTERGKVTSLEFQSVAGFLTQEDTQSTEANYSKILGKEVPSSPQKDTAGSLCSSHSKDSSQL